MNQKENVLQNLTENIIVSMEKFMLPEKMLNIIAFCKVQHDAYKCHAYKKKHVHQTVLWLCLGFMLPLSTVDMNY